MVYNVSYDLCEPGQKYKKLHELIVKISNNRWAHILDSTYIIQSSSSSEQIYKYLSSALDKNDKIFISEVLNYYGYLESEHIEYIKGLF